MSIITIISHPPRPAGARTAEDTREFNTKAEAIAYIESLPEPDALPSGDGTSES
jgi:hypothetical protein